MLKRSLLASITIIVTCWSMPTGASAAQITPERVDRLWCGVLEVLQAEQGKEQLIIRPRVLISLPDQNLSRYGGVVLGFYNFLSNTIVAVDQDVLVHELFHAALFQLEGVVASRDEERVRRLSNRHGKRIRKI